MLLHCRVADKMHSLCERVDACSLHSKCSCIVPVQGPFPYSGSMLIRWRAKKRNIEAGGSSHHTLFCSCFAHALFFSLQECRIALCTKLLCCETIRKGL